MTRGKRFHSSSSAKKFDVFEFSEDDAVIEKASWRITSKFRNPSVSRSSSITKYDFLQAFAGGAEPEPVSKHVNADPIDLDDEQDEECIPEEPLEVVDVDEDDDEGGDTATATATGIGDNQEEEPECIPEEPLEVVVVVDHVDNDHDGGDTATGIGNNNQEEAEYIPVEQLEVIVDDDEDEDGGDSDTAIGIGYNEEEEVECIPEEPLEVVDDDDEDGDEDGGDSDTGTATGIGENQEVECIPEEPLEVVDDDDEDQDGGDSDTAPDIGVNQVNYANACTIDMPLQHFADKQNPGFAESDFDFRKQLLDALSDDDASSQTSSSSTSTSNLSEVEAYFEDQLMDDGSVAFKINHIKKAVDVSPDYIQYEDLYSTQSRLTFSGSSLKLEGSKLHGSGGTFKIEWQIEDIIMIESQWCGKVETALINLLLNTKDFREPGITNQSPGSKMLKFAVYDSYWSKAEEAIKLLDVRYSDIWNTVYDIDTYNQRSIASLGKDGCFSHRPYFPIFDEAFDEVIYPKGEPDAVSISKRDVELLQPETFINDTVIDFYIKYLKNKLPTDEQEKFHFFNSFFFRKLADLDKNPSSACDGRKAFERVRKWTRKVNIFEKDYILIPINYSLHWSLAIICHPGEVTRFGGGEIKESSKVPCILHMDSLKGSHKGLKDVFQSYLCEEWKERHANVEDDISSKFSHLRFISLELPQQDNLYDCGIFLLHYVERFLEEAPINFNPFEITKFSNFLTSNWFPPAEASLKRSLIQNLIHDISGHKFLQAPPADCHEKGHSCEVPGVIKHNVKVDSPDVCSNPATWHMNPSNSTFDIHLSTASPIRVASHSKDLPAAVVTTRSACIQRGFMSPIEETDEFNEETALSLERESSQVGMLTTDFPSTSYFGEAVKGHSYSKSSTVSWNTFDTCTHEDQPLQNIEEFNTPDKTTLEYLSNSGEELAHSIVQDSQEANDEHDVDVSVKSHSLFRENVNSVTRNFFDLTDMSLEEDHDDDDDDYEPLSSEPKERDAKRPKPMNASGGPSRRRPLTRSMLKEAYVFQY